MKTDQEKDLDRIIRTISFAGAALLLVFAVWAIRVGHESKIRVQVERLK